MPKIKKKERSFVSIKTDLYRKIQIMYYKDQLERVEKGENPELIGEWICRKILENK